MYEYDNSGLPVAVIGVIQDTTDRVAMERELKATKDLLEIKLENASGKVVESIRELKKEIEIRIQTEKSLLAAKEEIQQKAATQRAFFRDSTHILRTSIDNIWKSVLGDIHAEKENSIDFQSLVAGQITHSRMQLDGIIDFLALETGLKPEPEPFDPRDLIKEIEDCFTKECQQCGLTMSTLIAPSTPQMINADKRRISLVLFALLSRSIRLSNWGEVRLTVAIDNELPACFTASIQDTSTPANAVDIKNEFYPTNQIDKKTKEYNSCLSLVGPIIDMLGGTIHTSSIGVGQQISLTIPVALEATKARPPHADPKSNIRLLVVEDDLTSQFLMKRMFTKIDYQADFATNGERALLLAAENKYDAILMDIQLPGLDGLETTRQIRIRTELPNATTPIIAVTAHAMQGDRKACLEAGMTDYLAKPLEFDKLHQAIQTACR
ncbi:MAG: response regulator [Proteobacteria bacterium]|nr:response regulator [Pseudomonadota bacterium]